MTNPDGRVSLWNRGAERIWGWEQDEVLGQRLQHFTPPRTHERGTPDQRCDNRLWTAAMRKRDGEPQGRVTFLGQRRGHHTVDDNRQLIGFSAVTRDLTDRKRAEEELQILNASSKTHR